MACTRPLNAYKAPGGGISFKAPGAYMDRAFNLACGQCLACRIAKQQAWSIRAAHEAQMHKQNCFITLTYRDEDLPEDGSLKKEHWQLFAKRARKKLGKLRFLHCGEYGEQTLRPHYHALIFGQDFSFDRVPVTKRGDHLVYLSGTLAELWPYGAHEVGTLTWDSAQYVARYTLKKVTGDKGKEAYQRITKDGELVPVEPEYATMSNRPGIGKDWFEKYVDDVYPWDEVILNGKSYRPPPYYDSLLKEMNPSLHEEVIRKRHKHRNEGLKKLTYTEYQHAQVKEKILASKTGLTDREHNLD